MWNAVDCEDVDLDLEGLTDIYKLCSRLDDGTGMDSNAINACVDAIRDILLSEVHVPQDPLGALGHAFSLNPMAIKMLAESLVWGRCASDGRTSRWLEEAEGSKWSEFSEALETLSMGFAKKAMGGDSPDLMEPCAYHIHPPGTKCGEA